MRAFSHASARVCKSLTLITSEVFVFENTQVFDQESLRVVVRAYGISQAACRDERPLRDVAFTDDLLPCEGLDSIGIAVEIASDAVHDDILRYVRGDDAVEISLLGKALVIGDGASVRKVQRPADIAFDGLAVGREGEEELVEA